MDSQIEEVKNRTDIVSLVSGYVSLKKAGRNYKGLCPFHSEKTPSFMVSAERQIFKCFGCGEGGDALTFFQKIEGVEFGEALKALAIRAGVVLKDYKPNPQEKQREVFFTIYDLATDFYHFLLTHHPAGKKALEYLKARNINQDSINKWKLGFAPENWDTAAKYFYKKKFSQKDLILSGLLVPSNRSAGYDRFRRRIIFPITNVSGQVVGFSGRLFGEGEPKYLNSPDSLVFNKSNNLFGLDKAKIEIKKLNQAVLVEGNLDVISSHQIGISNVVAPLGTALTEKQIELIRRFTETLVISFDSDQAGVGAAKKGFDLAENLGLNVKLAKLSGKDPDEIIKVNPENWKKAIENAVSIYDYLIDTTIERYGTTDPNSFRIITSEVMPFLARIENAITRSYYERYLANKLGVSESAVKDELRKVGSKNVNESETNPSFKVTEEEKLEEYLLSLLIQSHSLSFNLKQEDFQVDKLRAIFGILRECLVNNQIKQEEIEKKLPPDLKEKFKELSLLELPEEIINSQEEKIVLEINTCTLRLKELNLRTRLQQLGLTIKQAEISKQAEKLVKLTKEFKDLSAQLSEIEKSRGG